MSTVTDFPPLWSGLIDDAAIFPPGNSPLPAALEAWNGGRESWYAPLAATFVVTDTRLGQIDTALPLSVVVTGSIAEALSHAEHTPATVAALEVAVRDDDLLKGVTRIGEDVVTARASARIADGTPVYVELPQGPTTDPWLAAADAVADADLRLKFRTGGIRADLFPTSTELAGWIAAAVDRNIPFKCTAGLHRAMRHTGEDGFEHHGFLNVILATAMTSAGAVREDVIDLLDKRDGCTLAAMIRTLDADGAIAAARRLFTSYGSCSVLEPLDDLLTLDLLKDTP